MVFFVFRKGFMPVQKGLYGSGGNLYRLDEGGLPVSSQPRSSFIGPVLPYQPPTDAATNAAPYNSGAPAPAVQTPPVRSSGSVLGSNTSGGYSKSGAAAAYGVSTAQLEQMARDAGFNSTQAFVESGQAGAGGLRNEISSGYDDYLSSLDQQLQGLSGQQGALQSQAQSVYNKGANDLGLQFSQGQQDLARNREEATVNQNKNLRDISSSIRNAFLAGNVYLGARGAGDSSAANQYSYALNKQGTQQRSDVMGDTARILADVNQRESNLKQTYNTALNNLEQDKNIQFSGIQQWFYDAQRQLQEAKAQGGLAKSQDLANLSRSLLDQALQRMNQIQVANQNRRQQLEQWALGVSGDINALKSNLQGISQYSPQLPQTQNFNGMPNVAGGGAGNIFYGGYGGNDEKKNSIFG